MSAKLQIITISTNSLCVKRVEKTGKKMVAGERGKKKRGKGREWGGKGREWRGKGREWRGKGE
jgi:hypothetical protein